MERSKASEGDALTVDAVVQRLGVTARTLHYYEEVGLIAPADRTSGGHRLYNQETVRRLEQILRLKENLGYSLQEIRQVLEAETALEGLKVSYHSKPENARSQREIVTAYVNVLQDLIAQMNDKMERIEAMRDAYQARLQRSQTLLQQLNQDADKE